MDVNIDSKLLSQKVCGSSAAPKPRADEKLSTDDGKQLAPSPLSGAALLYHQACLSKLSLGRTSAVGNKYFYADSTGFHVIDNTFVNAPNGTVSSDPTGAVASVCDVPVQNAGTNGRTADWIRLRSLTIRGCVRLISTTVAAVTATIMPTVKVALIRDSMPLLTTYGVPTTTGMRTFAADADPSSSTDFRSVWLIGSTGWTTGQYPIQCCVKNRIMDSRYDIIAERLIDNWEIPIAQVQSSTGVNLGMALPQKNFEIRMERHGQGELMQWWSDVVGSTPYSQINCRYMIVLMTDNAVSPPETIDVTWGWTSELVYDDTPADS